MNCLTCATDLGPRNVTGYCRRHIAAANAVKPAWKEAQRAGVVRKIAVDPVFAEALRGRSRALSGTPEMVARRTQHFKAARIWELGNAAQGKGSDARRRAGVSTSETRLAWCPRELRPAYFELQRSKGLRAAEARALILEQHERDMARFRDKLMAASR